METRIQFCLGHSPWYVDQTPVDDTVPKSIWAHKLDLIGVLKNRQTDRQRTHSLALGGFLEVRVNMAKVYFVKFLKILLYLLALGWYSAKAISKGPCYGKATAL